MSIFQCFFIFETSNKRKLEIVDASYYKWLDLDILLFLENHKKA